MMSDDITYCALDCNNTSCERHKSHSKMTYDSFAYFEECSDRIVVYHETYDE